LTRQEIDIILIQKAKNGSQKAFNLLFSYYYSQVYHYINAIVKNSIESEDLAMITLEKAFSKIGSYYPFYTFKAWIFKIARNTALDSLSRFRPNLTSLDIRIIDKIENPEERLIRLQTFQNLEIKVNNLCENYRNAIQLFYFEDRPVKEICQILNINPVTLRSHLFRGRRKLKAS
jgi:RNA polymerase sigma-70 factor (ECF subfamily)